MLASSLGTCPLRIQKVNLNAFFRFRSRGRTLRPGAPHGRTLRRLACPLYEQAHGVPFDTGFVKRDVAHN